jgi:membrane-associated phospholipid phosphatase
MNRRCLPIFAAAWSLFTGRAEAVRDWNALMLDAVRLDNSSPTLSSRNFAILHTAIYDAVNSVERTHQPYRFQLDAPADSSAAAAAVGAAHTVMLALYPPIQARADQLFVTFVASQAPTPGLTNGLALGQQVGRLQLESRQADGANTQVPYIPRTEPGQWRRTLEFLRPPLDPHWRYVQTFSLESLEPFVPGPPPALDSAEYAAAYEEVKALGAKASLLRTAEQSEIALFWSDFSYTGMPPGHWHEIASTIAADRQLPLAESARLFALLSVAQADAAIVCWEAKYRYNFWRPITAIRRGAEDGNDATAADDAWVHFLNAPPFPAYISGHSTFSQSSAVVLHRFFGTDALSFAARSDSLPGVVRNFTSLAACADEVGLSRIYGGIHFQFDNVEGKRSGAKIGEFVTRNFLLPNARLPLLLTEVGSDVGPHLRLHGHWGATLIVEASDDLANWTATSTNVAKIGGVTVPLDPVGAVRFFRVQEQ